MLCGIRIVCSAVLAAAIASYDVDDPSADHFTNAVEMDEAGDMANAILSFRSVTKFTPTSAAFNNLGTALIDEGNPQAATIAAKYQAVMAFEKALELDPRNTEAAGNLILLDPANEFMKTTASAGKKEVVHTDVPPIGAVEQVEVSPDGETRVNTPDFDEHTRAFIRAIQSQNVNVALDLCQQGKIHKSASVFGGDQLVLTYMAQFLRPQNWDLNPLMECLIKNGLDVNTPGPKGKAVPLLMATQNRNMGLLELLVKKGANISASFNYRDGTPSGVTAAHTACFADPTQYMKNAFGSMEDIEFMAKHMVGIARKVDKKAAKIVSDAMENFDAQFESGREVYGQVDMQNIMNGESIVVLDLILKTDPDNEWKKSQWRDDTGKTPMHVCAKYGNPVGVKLLLKKYPDMVNLKDKTGATPLDIAQFNGRVSVVDVLLSAGGSAGRSADKQKTKSNSEAAEHRGEPGSGGWDQKIDEKNTISHCDIDERWNITGIGRCI